VKALTLLKAKTASGNEAGPARNWLSPMNLHWAGAGLLALVNAYLLVQMALLWHASSKHDANAMAEQRIELKTAGIAAVPLRGLDAKLAMTTTEADRFYRDRLPGSDSEMLAELGVLTKKSGVRLIRNSYQSVTVLPDAPGQLSEVRMDATLSGDYRPLMLMVNSLERDRMFFVINAVTLNGQQSGTVNLRLRLTTYLRPSGSSELSGDAAAGAEGAGATKTDAATGGPGR
jgi:type IV pilus assembly protein PilO